jgi:chromosome segregation ATPase
MSKDNSNTYTNSNNLQEVGKLFDDLVDRVMGMTKDAAYREMVNEINRLNVENSQLRKELASLRSSYDILYNSIGKIRKALESRDREVGGLLKDAAAPDGRIYLELKARLQEAEKKNDALEQQVFFLQDKLQEAESRLGALKELDWQEVCNVIENYKSIFEDMQRFFAYMQALISLNPQSEE